MPRAQDGRSLKDFELLSLIFRHRLSYMIYSQSFEHLPDVFKKVFYDKLLAILQGTDEAERYAYLKEKEGQWILRILLETTDFAGRRPE